MTTFLALIGGASILATAIVVLYAIRVSYRPHQSNDYSDWEDDG